jgi:hypothetical protein
MVAISGIDGHLGGDSLYPLSAEHHRAHPRRVRVPRADLQVPLFVPAVTRRSPVVSPRSRLISSLANCGPPVRGSSRHALSPSRRVTRVVQSPAPTTTRASRSSPCRHALSSSPHDFHLSLLVDVFLVGALSEDRVGVLGVVDGSLVLLHGLGLGRLRVHHQPHPPARARPAPDRAIQSQDLRRSVETIHRSCIGFQLIRSSSSSAR